MVIDQVRRKVAEQGIDGATPVLTALRDTVRACYNEWFPTVPPMQPIQLLQTGQVAMRPDLAFLVGGYDFGEKTPTARLFGMGSLLDFSPMLHDYGFAVQGVAQYALYLLNRLYEPGRTVQELTALAVYAITETASQDGKVGGPVNVITIKPGAEGCVALAPDVVQQVREKNDSRSKALRDSFYERR